MLGLLLMLPGAVVPANIPPKYRQYAEEMGTMAYVSGECHQPDDWASFPPMIRPYLAAKLKEGWAHPVSKERCHIDQMSVMAEMRHDAVALGMPAP